VKPRITVRKTPAGWVVTRPRLGFAPEPETFTADSAPAAWRWLRRVEKPRGGSAIVERTVSGGHSIAPFPRWSTVRRY
jgi:hypothetical protein